MEMRTANFKSEFRTREEETGEKIIAGYFIVYNQQTELWHNFFEEIASGACTKSLNLNDVRALYNHDSNFVLGRKSAGTLMLKEDSYGVYGEIKINPNDSEAVNIYERVKRGDIDGCSFGFYSEYEHEEYIKLTDDISKCIIKEADVREVSVCPFPAYPQTQISARKQDFERRQDFEKRKNELKERLRNG
ncbi:HK97 family phage prohead protease [Anaerotignum sp. MB30-C6]|uniref:HK97 family phage prohead protease n=1 Tax=Anaerotignum sp. MB30-C6 TaxID=3070814 RepID=UPI0027DB2CD5|nr:HK97 family phage prohead protease [Anaerotignum sp. MB30-C6]WMI82089.1 HK97 family phage prohead protease [Anaerotignum sp. MB30-C6]